VDAERIAVYAYKEKETLKLWTPTREVVKKLKHLSVLRVRPLPVGICNPDSLALDL
jgi:uncharacterized protein YaeQ